MRALLRGGMDRSVDVSRRRRDVLCYSDRVYHVVRAPCACAMCARDHADGPIDRGRRCDRSIPFAGRSASARHETRAKKAEKSRPRGRWTVVVVVVVVVGVDATRATRASVRRTIDRSRRVCVRWIRASVSSVRRCVGASVGVDSIRFGSDWIRARGYFRGIDRARGLVDRCVGVDDGRDVIDDARVVVNEDDDVYAFDARARGRGRGRARAREDADAGERAPGMPESESRDDQGASAGPGGWGEGAERAV